MEITLDNNLIGHQNQIFSLVRNNNTLFSGGNDKGVVEWDLEQMKFRRILCSVSHSVYTLHIIPDTDLIAIGLRSGEIMIVDFTQQKLIAKLKVNKGAIFNIKTVASKSELVAIGEEGVAYIFSLDNFNLLYRFRVSGSTIRIIETDTDEKFIYFGDKEGVIYQYKLSDYQLENRRLIHNMPVTSLLIHGDNLFSGGRDAKMYKIQVDGLQVSQEVTPHMFTVYGIVRDPNSNLIATASRDKSWKIWETEPLHLLKNVSTDRGYDSHRLSINSIVWADNQIITSGDDKEIRVWKIEKS